MCKIWKINKYEIITQKEISMCDAINEAIRNRDLTNIKWLVKNKNNPYNLIRNACNGNLENY